MRIPRAISQPVPSLLIAGAVIAAVAVMFAVSTQSYDGTSTVSAQSGPQFSVVCVPQTVNVNATTVCTATVVIPAPPTPTPSPTPTLMPSVTPNVQPRTAATGNEILGSFIGQPVIGTVTFSASGPGSF